MHSDQTRLSRLLQSFHRATGIGAFFLDRGLCVSACATSMREYYRMPALAIDQIVDFVSKTFANDRSENNSFHTFIMEHNLISNIVFLNNGNECAGALATEPVFVKKMNLDDMERLARQHQCGSLSHKDLIDFFTKIPVVPYERIMPLGEALHSMSRSVVSQEGVRQVLRRGAAQSDSVARPTAAVPSADPGDWKAGRHSPVETYQKIQEAIRNGDVAGLERVMGGISAGSIPMDQLNRADFVRSVKNSFIKSCAMACFAAIEANAPFIQVMDMSDEYIQQMEQLTNIYDIYDLMWSAVVSFARIVATNKGLYSKPVRQSVDYIKGHYAEKITLGRLAELANVSSSYLSNLMKNETGLSLSDNINKFRIAESKRLLRDQNISVLDVALRVGFPYQNHFASVFRKFAGCSPKEYRELLLQPGQAAAGGRFPSEHLSIATNQIDSFFSVFPKIFDMVRIVDPASHTAWIVRNNAAPFEQLPETCYRFWHQNKSCENCVSKRAYSQNDTIYKLDYRAECPFLVLAAPRRIGNKLYVAEFLKDLSGALIPKEAEAGSVP